MMAAAPPPPPRARDRVPIHSECIDGRLLRDARESLRRAVVVRMRPFRARSLERMPGQIDQAPVDSGAEDGLRRRSDGLQRVAVHQESPAPKPEFGTGGALCLRTVPNARIGGGPETRTARRRKSKNGGGQRSE